MHIEGKCHCGNITYGLHWPGEGTNIPVRACSCSFCTKHGGTYTSHRDAELAAVVHDQALVSRYMFGTETAEFFLCSRCGVVPFVTSTIDAATFAVVNVNSFEDVDPGELDSSPTDFDGETVENRLARRRRGWIPDVTIEAAGG